MRASFALGETEEVYYGNSAEASGKKREQRNEYCRARNAFYKSVHKAVAVVDRLFCNAYQIFHFVCLLVVSCRLFISRVYFTHIGVR